MHRFLRWATRWRNESLRLIIHRHVVLEPANFGVEDQHPALAVGTDIYGTLHEEPLALCWTHRPVNIFQGVNRRQHLACMTSHYRALPIVLLESQHAVAAKICHKKSSIRGNAYASGLAELSKAICDTMALLAGTILK
jgi:hypothetical protein